MLEDFLEQFSALHGSRTKHVTDDIIGFEVTPSMDALLPGRRFAEFPLVLSEAVDAATEEASCRDLARLVDAALSRGIFCRAVCQPRLDHAQALAALGKVAGSETVEAAGPRAIHSRVEQRQFGLLNYRVVYRHLQDEVIHPSFAYDLANGHRVQPAQEILIPEHPWESHSDALGHAMRVSLQAAHEQCVRELESSADRRLGDIRRWLADQEKDRKAVMESYFDELAKELEEERRSVYYHLYFFEKEQEIEEKIKRIQHERAHRKGASAPHVDPECTIELINVGVFSVPFLVLGENGTAAEIDLLEAKLALVGGRWLSTE